MEWVMVRQKAYANLRRESNAARLVLATAGARVRLAGSPRHAILED
jgi:hypothetical protein